jgi:molybdate transport system regulatory protein
MPDDLSASVTFRRGDARVGLDRVALIEAVAELGTISGAARRLGLSYKAAWDAVQALNNLFDAPLISAASGGRQGGAAVVTPQGRAVIGAFARVRAEMDLALAKLGGHVAGEPASDLFWSLGMRTSARNALRGRVRGVARDAVSAEVTLGVADGVEITASLTRRSVDELGLTVGKSAIALIKASSVVLARQVAAGPDVRNRIRGVVVRREDDPLNSEVAVDIGGGKTMVATVSLETARALELAAGVAVTALVDASDVILAVE